MRSEIADSLMPYFYEGLENHQSVHSYPDIKGFSKNLFFFNHTHPEVQEGDSTSRQNEFEAKMIVGLCKYLIQQGYKQSRITVLCCYAGQMFLVKKLMKNKMLEAEYQGILVTVVDNYQGEENDIILLSFVRSNKDKQIGFLKTKNRVCVALSRAKHGLFCFGNFAHLASCSRELWAEIVEKLKHLSFLGEILPLRCQIHKTDLPVKKFEDFSSLSPEGGCKELCNYRMDCGHVCKKYCHPDDADHLKIVCVSDCQRKCPEGHPCKKICSQPCGDCKIPVDRILPLCGHSNKAPCYKSVSEIKCQMPCDFVLTCSHKCAEICDPKIHTTKCKVKVWKILPCRHCQEVCCFEPIDKVQCQTKLKKTWPRCGHENETMCSTDVYKEKCQRKCHVVLDCGHPCTGTCDTCRNERLHVPCNEVCTKRLICGHDCDRKCNLACPPCEKDCQIRCTHSACTIVCQQGKGGKGKSSRKGRACGLPCPPCTEQCAWECEHFKCTKLCSEVCDRPKCDKPCEKLLPCKHKCLGMCGERCPLVCAECPRYKKKYDEIRIILFGSEEDPNARFIQLTDCNHIFEVSGFDYYVKTRLDSIYGAEKIEIKLLDCPTCRKVILTCLRYGNEVKCILTNVQNVKRKIQGDLDSLKKEREILTTRLASLEVVAHFEDEENEGYVFRNVYKNLNLIVKNPRDNQLTSDRLVRLTNMVSFMEQLTEMHSKITVSFATSSLATSCTFESGGSQPVSGSIVTSSKLLGFFSKWFPTWVDGTLSKRIERTSMAGFLHFEVSKLVQLVGNSYKTASPQMMTEFSNEIQRLDLLLKFVTLLNKMVERDTQVRDISNFDGLMQIFYGNKAFVSGTCKSANVFLRDISEKCSVGNLGITDNERKEILEAMAMTQGHWFTCKNGHVYCITECGGAMQESTCPECHERIGGSSHTLLDGNRVATEMDGATRSAFDRDRHLYEI